jgi:hyaluronan synthase
MVTQDKHQCFSLSAASQVLRGVLHISLLCTIFYYRDFLTAGFPLLVEAILQIILSEINRRRQSIRLKQAEGENDSKDLEHLDLKSIWPTPCVGSVVGYREDPLVFQKCLESYHQDFDKALKVLVIGIDGNELEDLEMVKTAESVCLKFFVGSLPQLS